MGTAGIAAGLVCGVAAAACFELGYVAQAADARRVEGDRLGLLLRLARRRSWLGGSALGVCGLLLQLLALYLAPLSVSSPRSCSDSGSWSCSPSAASASGLRLTGASRWPPRRWACC